VGLFVLVHGLETAGVIESMAKKLLDATGGDPKVTAIAILWGSAILSAFIDNNGTLIGASANLVVAGMAERAGHPVRLVP
jgi:Na+/H+ antiporter NhaD/arsenite permease-like protein